MANWHRIPDPAAVRLKEVQSRLDQAEKVADEAERQLKVLANASDNEGDKVASLDKNLKAAKVHMTSSDATWCHLLYQDLLHETERRYEEAARKLLLTETDLEKAEERAEVAEAKLKAQTLELTQVTNELKTLELRFVWR